MPKSAVCPFALLYFNIDAFVEMLKFISVRTALPSTTGCKFDSQYFESLHYTLLEEVVELTQQIC